MGHTGSKEEPKQKRKSLEKEKSRSRHKLKLIKIKTKSKSDSNLNKNNILNNNNNNNGDDDSNPTTPTSPTTPSSYSVPSTPKAQERHLNNGDANNVNNASPNSNNNNNNDLSSSNSDHSNSNSENGDNDNISNNKSNSNSNINENGSIEGENGNSSREIRKSVLMESTIFSNGDAHEHVVEEAEPETECALCAETAENLYTLEVCGHCVCIACLFAYTEKQLKDISPDCHEVFCPIKDCKCIISSNDLKTALDTFGAKATSSNGVNGNGKAADVEQANGNGNVHENGNGSSDHANGNEQAGGQPSGSDGAPGSSNLRGSIPSMLPIQLTQSLEVLLSKGNYVHCPNPSCKFVFEKLPPTPRRKGDVVLDDAGNAISLEAMKHREEHRFRCRVCGTNFCSACKTVPYHLGFTCKQKMASLRAKHCRFCNASLPPNAKPHPLSLPVPLTGIKKKEKRGSLSGSFLRKWKGKEKKAEPEPPPVESEDVLLEENPKEYFVCKSGECSTKMNAACPKFVAKCNHMCNGSYSDVYEKDCFCLRPECCEEGQNQNEYCNICWIEPLGSGPCLKLNCGHIFHETCLRSKLSKQWPGPAISFNFMNCPLCTQVISHRSLDYIVGNYKELLEQVKTKALQRLEIEGLTTDPRITDPESEYHNKPGAYAMNIFSFYQCYICKNAYFGGRRQCEVPAEGADPAVFNPAELLCGGCSTLNAECKKHGKEYIEFKCRFCCSLATFYCGGKAHFCTPCHDKAGQLVEFVNWATIAKCEPCKGPGLCPLGVPHDENGEEFSLGCSMCRANVS